MHKRVAKKRMKQTTERAHSTARNERDLTWMNLSVVHSTLVVHFAILLLLLFYFSRSFILPTNSCSRFNNNGECVVQMRFCLFCVHPAFKIAFFSVFAIPFTFSPSFSWACYLLIMKKVFNNEFFFIVVDEHDWLTLETNKASSRLNASRHRHLREIIRSFWYNLMGKMIQMETGKIMAFSLFLKRV